MLKKIFWQDYLLTPDISTLSSFTAHKFPMPNTGGCIQAASWSLPLHLCVLKSGELALDGVFLMAISTPGWLEVLSHTWKWWWIMCIYYTEPELNKSSTQVHLVCIPKAFCSYSHAANKKESMTERNLMGKRQWSYPNVAKIYYFCKCYRNIWSLSAPADRLESAERIKYDSWVFSSNHWVNVDIIYYMVKSEKVPDLFRKIKSSGLGILYFEVSLWYRSVYTEKQCED